MPLIKTFNTTANVAGSVAGNGDACAAEPATSTTAATIDERKSTVTAQHYKAKNTANSSTTETAKTTTATATATATAAATTTNSTNGHTKLDTKRNRHRHSNCNSSNNKSNSNSNSNINRKHKTSLAKSVPATPVQVNPTTNTFVPSSTDYNDDDDPDYNDDMLYMPPYSYPLSSIDFNKSRHNDHHHDMFRGADQTQLLRNGLHQQEQQEDEEEEFREASADNHPLEMMHHRHQHSNDHRNDDDNDDDEDEDDSSSMAMITPPPPYDTPYKSGKQQQYHAQSLQHSSLQHQHSAPQQSKATYNTATKYRTEMPQTRKYLFNNRETFTISSSNGNSSSNSIHQQPVHTTSLGATLTNAITPTKLSAAAAAMFAAPQMVHLNRKWSNLHRKRRRRNSSSGDSKELDKLVLQSVDWDENDIY